MESNRYRLVTDRLINRLTPHYLCGRRYLLLLQSLVWPLQGLNDRFRRWARERQVEAAMTSQVLYLEWWLTERFRPYFVSGDDSIRITDSEPLGVALYHEDSATATPFTVWFEDEQVAAVQPGEQPRALYLRSEEKALRKVSFVVSAPRITLPTREFVYMLSHAVNRYRLAGKTFLIRIDGQEIEPNRTERK